MVACLFYRKQVEGSGVARGKYVEKTIFKKVFTKKVEFFEIPPGP